MKKKGFTLVELLAVIVILAIVALVVVPVVMGVIKDARKKSAIESFRGYMDAVEKTIIRDSMKATSELPNKDSNGCYNLNDLNPKIKIKGDKPVIDDDDDTLCVTNGKITSVSEVSMHGYALEYKNDKILFNGKYVEDTTIPEITIGEITATKNSITIPYEVATGASGVTVTCEYGTSESYGNQGTIEDNKCILNGLTQDTKYYFRINSRTGKKKTASTTGSEFTACEYTLNQQFNFGYTGGQQTFSPKCTGRYKLEVWGAQGGYVADSLSGLGGYAYGNYSITNINNTLYVVVGGHGNVYSTSRDYQGSVSPTVAGGYNGGGASGTTSYGWIGSSGGGATHIATATGVLSSLSSNKSSVLIVAGGGGGGGYFDTSNMDANGGAGGGYQGGYGMAYWNGTNYGYQNAASNNWYGSAPNQSSGYSFGQGDSVKNHVSGSYCRGGGGGGWYGGWTSSWSTCNERGGQGGSGYINTSVLTGAGMYMYNMNHLSGVSGFSSYVSPYACYASTSTATKTTCTSNYSSSAVSNYAKQGHGYARITYLGK